MNPTLLLGKPAIRTGSTLVITLFILTALVAGCTSRSATPTKPSAQFLPLVRTAIPSNLYGLPRDQTLVRLGSESNNPRLYDPALSAGNKMLFSGLVSFNPKMELTPDLAASWDIDTSRTIYTFHLRSNARFHDGRAFTAADVIYSWERAADPALASSTVLTYLGDIVGIRDRFTGKTDHISGLQAVDAHTLRVTIDAPKPYFLLKLTYGPALVVDRANVESGVDWYRKPNGTGPYKLIRWDPFKVQIYQRNDDFYLDPPAIKFVVYEIFAGVGVRLYETGQIDLAGISIYDMARVEDPTDRLHKDLLRGVSTCTSYVTFDVTQPPFDDLKVRQAFSLAVNRQQYVDVALRGESLPEGGLYPPTMPGYNALGASQIYDPQLARQRLSESKYGTHLPPIVFSTGGFGSNEPLSVEALVGAWQKNLGVSIQVENLEPDKYRDVIHSKQHGQLVANSWCADYLDPENFADALFHSDAQENLGHYSNPDLDKLLDQARVEANIVTRLQRYHQAEQMIIDDAAAIFLGHSFVAVVVKPYVRGYVLTPVSIPLERYLSIDLSKLP